MGRDGIVATRLCTHQDDVALTNERQLQELPGEQGAGARPDQLEKAIGQTSPLQPPLQVAWTLGVI